MQNKPSSVLVGLKSRPGPRGEWFSRRMGIVTAALYLLILSSVVISLVIERETHPLSILITITGFVIYGFIDLTVVTQSNKLSHSIVLADKIKIDLIKYWNWAGVISPLLVYFWMLNDTSDFAPVLLWPLLLIPYYFLLRIISPTSFYPKVLSAIVLYSLISLCLTFIISPEIHVLYTVVGAIWLLLSLIIISVYLRTWDYHNNRFEAYRELVSWSAGPSANLMDFEGKLKSLGERLKLERLVVLELFRPENDADYRDCEKENLTILPSMDPNSVRPPLYVKMMAQHIRNEHITPIRSWPLTRGLLAQAFEKRIAIKCMDTERLPCNHMYFNPEWASAYKNTRCEFIVPIFDAPDGMIIGFVDLQSDEPNSLQLEDLDYLTAIASAISPLMVKDKLTSLLKGLENLRATIENVVEERKLLELISEFAINFLDADVITYFPLGFGNGWPVEQPFRRGTWFPETDTDQQKNLIPIPLLSNWKTVFEEDSKSDRFIARIKDQDYIIREKIRSTIFIPIATGHRRVGGLFFDFRTPQHFSPSIRLSVEMLRQTVTPYLERGRQIDDAYRGFGKTAFVLHDLLNESLGTSALLENRLDSHRQSIDQEDRNAIVGTFDGLSETIKLHMKNIASASLKSALDDLKKLRDGLDNSFRSAAARLEERYLGRSFRWEFYPSDLDQNLSYDLRLAISSIVIEAAHNAVRSGDANLVKVKVTRELNNIEINILSNGQAWDPENPQKSYSKYGIQNRLEIAKKSMNADYHWLDRGRQLFVVIPILPTSDDEEEGFYAS